MAVDWNIKAPRTSEYAYYPEELVLKPHLNGRHDEPDITDLIASIAKFGQGQPVIVRKDGGNAVLVKGFNRVRAIAYINKHHLVPAKMRVRCCYTQLNEHEAFLENVVENHHRNPTSDIDDAHNIKRMRNVYRMTDEEIALVYRPSATEPAALKEAVRWVRNRAEMIDLTPEAEKAIQDGRVKGPAARAIAKLTADLQKEVLKGDGLITGKDIRRVTGKPTPPQTGVKAVKTAIQNVLETGKFSGIGGKTVQASDDMLEFLALLLNPQAGKKKGAAA